MTRQQQQQRRVARRFKRTQRVTQHHQRGRVDMEFVMWLAILTLLVVSVGTFIGWVITAEHKAIAACEAQGGQYVYTGRNGSDLCIRRDAVVLP